MAGLAAGGAHPRTFIIDASHLRAHRTASSLAVKRAWTTDRSDKGGMNTKFHAVADGNAHPLSFFLTAGPSATTPGQRRF